MYGVWCAIVKQALINLNINLTKTYTQSNAGLDDSIRAQQFVWRRRDMCSWPRCVQRLVIITPNACCVYLFCLLFRRRSAARSAEYARLVNGSRV